MDNRNRKKNQCRPAVEGMESRVSTSGIPPAPRPPWSMPPDPGRLDPGRLAIDQARSFLNRPEGKNGNLFTKHFHRSPDESWCADFVSYCFETTGNPLGMRGKGFNNVKDMVDWFRDHGRWDKQPAVGAVVAIDISSKLSSPSTWGKYDHVGIVTGYTKDKITYISGDTDDKHGNKGVVDEHKLDRDSQIIGYGHR